MTASAHGVDPQLRCRVCGSSEIEHWATAHDVEYRTSDAAFDYRRCSTCGLLFLDPPPTDRLDEIYPANYYAYVDDEISAVERVKRLFDGRRLRRLLRQLPGDALRILDVGGADGSMLTLARQADPRVHLTQIVDIDAGAEASARRRGHEYFHGSIDEFAAPDRYDLVLLLNVLEHTADPGAVLAKLRDLLVPGGIVLVQTPNTDSLDARLFRHRDWGGYHCPRHWMLFERHSITRVAVEAGLHVQRFSYTQGAPFWTVSVLAELARRGRARITPSRPVVEHPLFSALNAVFGAFDLVRAFAGAKTSQMILELAAA